MKQARAHTPAQNLRFALRVIWLLTRGFAAILVGLVTLATLLALFLPRLVDSRRVKATLEVQLSQILQRPVGINGVILTPQGIKLDGVRVDAKDGSGKSILESQFAIVTFKLRPLLDKRLELSQVRLVSPTIHIWRNADGSWNIADLFTSTAAAQAMPIGKFQLPVSLYADNTVIENGELHVEDALGGTRHSVKRLNLALHKFDLEHPFTFSVKFENRNQLKDREIDAAVAMDGSASLANLDFTRAYLRASKLELKLDGQPIRGSGGVEGFPMTSVDAELLLPAVGQTQWDAYLKKPLDLQIPPSRWKIKARFLDARRFHVDNVQVSAGALTARAVGLVDISTAHPHVDAELYVSDFPLSQAAGFRQALGSMGLQGTASGDATVSGWTDRLVVHKAHAHWRDAAVAFKRWAITKGAADLTVTDDFEKLALTVSQGALSAFAQSASNVELSLNVKGKDLKVDRLAFKWGESHVRVRGRVVNLSNPKQVEIAGNADRIRWESAQALVENIIASVSTRTLTSAELAAADRKPWVQTFKYAIPHKFPDSVGHIRVGEISHKNFSFRDTDIQWDLHGVTPTLKRVDGDIRVAFGPGTVSDIESVRESNKFLSIVFLPYIYMHKMNNLSVLSAATAYPKSLDFNRIEGQYTAEKGLVTTKFFHVDSPQLVAYAEGTADFGKESVDMGILTRLTSYRAPLPEWWVDELGRPAIGFRVKGDLNKPDLEPRLHKMESDEIEKMLVDGRARAKARFESIEKLETP